MCFWALTYLLFNTDEFKAMRNQTQSAIRSDTTIPFSHLSIDCPRLDAILSEYLRIYNATSLTRIVAEPTTVGRNRLSPGSRVIYLMQELHTDPDVYGQDPSLFDPDRFL